MRQHPVEYLLSDGDLIVWVLDRAKIQVRRTRLDLGRRPVVELPVARAEPAVLHVVLEPVGTDLGERHLDIGIVRARAEPQVDAARADDGDVLLERSRRIRDGGALDGTDVVYQVIPWLQVQAVQWHGGHFPLWDPHLWAGQPLVGQVQPGLPVQCSSFLSATLPPVF